MAKRKVNKAQAIRDEFDSQGHAARPRDIVAALLARKIKVSPTQVSNIKTKLNGAPAKNGKAHKATDLISLSGLRAAKMLVDSVGSTDAAKAALDALALLN